MCVHEIDKVKLQLFKSIRNTQAHNSEQPTPSDRYLMPIGTLRIVLISGLYCTILAQHPQWYAVTDWCPNMAATFCSPTLCVGLERSVLCLEP